MIPHAHTLSRALLAGATPILLGACTLVGGVPTGSGTTHPIAPAVPAITAPSAPARPAPAAATPTPEAAAITAEAVDIALGSIGTPYEWGGTDANGFDCSGLIQFAYAKLGVRIPRTSGAQIRHGEPVPRQRAELLPGDVLGFSAGGSGGTDHVGLYVGDGEFIHSSSSGVRVSSLHNPYWWERFVAARRVVE